MTINPDWEAEAARWIAWARHPLDAYWFFREAFFELVPPPGAATLEVGCGEGRVARDLRARGHRVAAIDASATLVAAASEADPEGDYRMADAAALPFPDASFDLVVAYNSLMDVADMPAAVREAGRVLVSGGRLCACITHPLADAGRFTSTEPDAPFVVEGSYFGRRRFEETFERRGLTMTFRGWCYPLEDYVRALGAAGLLLETLREPRAPRAEVEANPSAARWQRVPNFLLFRAVKP
jgi:SAM-dependent methyltransferase